MKKPQKQTHSYYDYLKCKEYLEKKYGYNERDCANQSGYHKKIVDEITKKYGGDGFYTKVLADMDELEKKAHEEFVKLDDKEQPYQDFWHWVLEYHDVHNGGHITFSADMLDGNYYFQGKWEFARKIFQYYIDEFADEEGEIDFLVEW